MRKGLEDSKGFTLLEVMASVAILGIAIVMLIQVFSGGLALARATEEHTELALLAKEKLSDVMLRTVFKEGIEKGEEDGLLWEIKTVKQEKSLSSSHAEIVIYKVIVNVREEGAKNGYELTTLKTVVN